jgi:hypothetical protein
VTAVPLHNGVARKTRRMIATYSTYREAERAIGYLADRSFPVERVAIVARDLKPMELVAERTGYREAALKGAASGLVVGVLVGWLFGVFDWFNPVLSDAWLAFQGLWFGAVVGALTGLGMQALQGGRRDFASIAAVEAAHFDLIADQEVAPGAARLLTWFESVAPPKARAG